MNDMPPRRKKARPVDPVRLRQVRQIEHERIRTEEFRRFASDFKHCFQSLHQFLQGSNEDARRNDDDARNRREEALQQLHREGKRLGLSDTEINDVLREVCGSGSVREEKRKGGLYE